MIDIKDSLSRDMGVDLSRGQITVAEQFLNAPEIGAAVKKVGGEAVAQRVWTGVASQPRPGEVVLQQPPNAPAGETVAVTIEKQGPLRTVAGFSTADNAESSGRPSRRAG